MAKHFSTIETLIPALSQYSNTYDLPAELIESFPARLKKSILQMTVQGKLVPQDLADEPAEVLLARIREEKQRLVREGKIKKEKQESIIFRRDNSHYETLSGIERCIDEEIRITLISNSPHLHLQSVLFFHSSLSKP